LDGVTNEIIKKCIVNVIQYGGDDVTCKPKNYSFNVK
jgi:hypothetical protein